MGNRTLLALAAAAALAAPRIGAAGEGWSLTLGVWGGVSRYDVMGLKHGVGTVDGSDGEDLLDGNFDTVGGSALLRLGWLDLGVLYEGTLLERDAKNEVLTPLVGVAWDLSRSLRLDALVELGGHRITGVGRDAETVWLPYVGLRPSLSYRMPVGPVRLVLSATPFARWDLVKEDVSADTSSTDPTVYELGGTTFGLVGGVGIEL